jgi:hypothetical protein
MATATPIYVAVTERKRDGVSLDLNDAEARFLMAVFYSVFSLSGPSESIYDALYGAGYRGEDGLARKLFSRRGVGSDDIVLNVSENTDKILAEPPVEGDAAEEV